MIRKHSSIDDTAAEWLGRRDGGLTVAQKAEFTAWLRADARNAEAFARLEAGSRALDQLAAFRPSSEAEPDPDLPLVRRPRRRIAWLPAAITAAAAAAVALVYVGWWRPVTKPVVAQSSDFTRSVVTEVGRVEKLTLPDGSVIDVNTDSAVAVVFSAAQRRVRLQHGEAHFTVAKNPSRPFIVVADGVAVRAVPQGRASISSRRQRLSSPRMFLS